MDFEKVGKIIAKQRNAKEMTQEQLAEKLRVDRTTISKWERAISTPDISLLQPLCKELDLTISELLNGEKNLKKEKNDEITIDAIKFYNKKSKNKYIRYFVFLVSIIICFCLSLLIVNNYNKFEIYKITSSQDDFWLMGIFYQMLIEKLFL